MGKFLYVKQISTGRVVSTMKFAKEPTDAQKNAAKTDLLSIGVDESDIEVGWVEQSVIDGWRNVTDAVDYAPDLATAKTKKIKELKLEGRKLGMEHIDPHIVKSLSPNDLTPVPTEVATYKTNLISNFSTTKTAINALTTIADVMNYNGMVWPTEPDA